MKTNENAPRSSGSTSSAVASSDMSGWPARSAVMRSESLVALGSGRDGLTGSCAFDESSAVLVRLPLWPRAMPPPFDDGRYDGCAFSQVQEPGVEERVWPTARGPVSADRDDSSKTWATRPSSL